jgi:glucan phosphoethanolaminetransferase (alkaline phosphatase superfamily)
MHKERLKVETENELISNFYFGFWLYFAAVIALISVIILLIIFREKILLHFSQTNISKVFLFSIIGILFMVNAFFSIKFTTYCLDIDAVRNRNFEVLTGTVIDYTKATYNENGTVDYFGPIIKIEGSEETIILNVGPTELNKTYTFIYLKHTKVARIKPS